MEDNLGEVNTYWVVFTWTQASSLIQGILQNNGNASD